jgi:hypothetical protein
MTGFAVSGRCSDAERPGTPASQATTAITSAVTADAPAPPWARSSAAAKASDAAVAADAGGGDSGVPSLQEVLCGWLARHLHAVENLDDLPPHLSSLVRQVMCNDM